MKKYETIGCCGIDCGLCPRFHTKGDSVCPGCGGLNFKDKHPSCGFHTCCAIKNGHEVCAECIDYPCKRFDSEKNGYDSFVTHRKIFENLEDIKNKGITRFIENQNIRIVILKDLINNFDDERSKSFYCISCALLPLSKLQELHKYAYSLYQQTDTKEKIKLIKTCTTMMAESLNIDLKLNKKN